MAASPDWLTVARSQVVVSIGQLSRSDSAKLDAAAKRGEIAKWRDHWHGFGPLKNHYGPEHLSPAGKAAAEAERMRLHWEAEEARRKVAETARQTALERRRALRAYRADLRASQLCLGL